MRCALLLAIIVSLPLAMPVQGADRVLMEWDFSKASDTLGWTQVGQGKEFKLAEGALHSVASPTEHKFESPLFEITAKPGQYVEIELKTDATGTGVMYYSDTTEPPYHGFKPAVYARFEVAGDGKYHTCAVSPFWQKQGKVTHIRLDPPGAKVSIRAVRIVEMGIGEPTSATSWEFKDSSAGWQPMGDCRLGMTAAGCQAQGNNGTTVLSPALTIDSIDHSWATIRIASKSAHTALFRWATDAADGLQSAPIVLRGDGMVHSYTIDLADRADWTGRVLAIGITPADSNEPRAISLESVALGDRPLGPPELQITRFGLADPVTRVGEKARLIVEVVNTGGANAESVTGIVTMTHRLGERKGDTRNTADARGEQTTTTFTSSKTEKSETLFAKRIAVLAPGKTGRFEWEFPAESDAGGIAVCRVTGSGLDAGQKQIDLRFYPAVDKKKLAGLKYVPEPKPADTGDYLVGAYVYPGWPTYERWSVLDNFPERKPILGYYREGDPEVADWQMKWALEHGIGFFIYDWYWSAGSRQLEHAIHNGYFKSRYKDKFKFCLLWANHNPAGTSSAQDLEKVTQYWIDNYFKLPNYLKVDGKNVMVIFSPGRFTDDMGRDAVKAAFVKMRKMCEDAGVGGLYMVACAYPGPDTIDNLIYEGYDALSGYNYPGFATRGQQYAPYEWLVDGYKDVWNQISDASSIPYIPVCESGWDPRPWHGSKSFVRTGKSPWLWQKMLENAKTFVNQPKHKQPGDKKLVFLEAWNELGEGDYIEPHAEFGFDYLEAVRQVFAPKSPKPQIIVPKDVGMGPYEVARSQPKTEWDFSKAGDQTWHVGGMQNLNYSEAAMQAIAESGDPAFYSPGTRIDADKLKTIEIRMRMDKGTEAQLYFSRPRGQMSEQRSAKFAVTADNAWHVYTIDMSSNRLWKGAIGQIRIDPNSEAGSVVEIAHVKVK